MNQGRADFLDVATLLQDSQPRARGNWLLPGAGVFLLLVLGSALLSSQGGAMARLVSVLSALTMLGLIAGMALLSWHAVRSARMEQQQLEAIEELIQLRRWQDAAGMLRQLLARPTRSPAARVQGLIYLTMVLARYNRFDDAIAVHDHLLDNVPLDEATAHALRLGRAMAMLRVDHLLDADRAINELRRHLRASTADNDPAQASGLQSAGLVLLEMYRDVKTGHPDEAVQSFHRNLPLLRRQLGHRVGDAWALLAKACDMLGRQSDARQAYENATVLTDRLELERRYPELTTLSAKYQPTEAPLTA